MPKEKDFQLKVEKFLTDKGIYFVKYWGGGNFTRSGVPDLLCCIGGRFVGVELKTDNGKVSELQQYNIDKIIQSGGVALVLRPKDFKDFQSMVKNLKE
ncbi:MAG: VRR-NUC domain-containing protein [Oscillospiraceae bacterium]